MRYIKDVATQTIEIDKSVFIGLIFPLSENQDQQSIIQQVRMEHPKANHVCHASIRGLNGEYANSSDDGEPARTAGIPILEVMKHHDITDCLCVVVRYFGGIKLGAGGLVRAYTKTAAETLKQAKLYIQKTVPAYEISFAYNHIGTMDRHFEKKATILEKLFLETVTYRLYLFEDDPSAIHDIRHLCIRIETLNPHVIQIDI
jgi:uncharacterized YigZ family protein